MLVGKINKHYNDYQDCEVVRSLGTPPITGLLPATYFIEEETYYETVNPETIEALIERNTAPSIYEGVEFKVVVQDVLDSLTRTERKILQLRFGINMNHDYTLDEIGKLMDLSRERVRQLEARALRKMRYPTKSMRLVPYLWD